MLRGSPIHRQIVILNEVKDLLLAALKKPKQILRCAQNDMWVLLS